MVESVKEYHKKVLEFITELKEKQFRLRIPISLIFYFVGLLSTIWFLVRVIPKPSRATYPCMRATYPFMSGFIAYILGLAATIVSLKKSKSSFISSKYFVSALFLLFAICSAIFTITSDSIPVYANSKSLLGANQPIGIAKGIYPGRVVWSWDPNSTNENILIDETEVNDQIFGEGWFLSKNTNMSVANTMVSDAIKKLTEKETISDAWEELFKYFNKNHGKGEVGYKEGEKIFIKTNQVSASSSSIKSSNFEIKNTSRYGMAETSPQVVLAILRQLINDYGVEQENISVGDPMKHIYKHVFDMWKNEFPNIICIDSDARLGRTALIKSSEPSIYYSDRGKILRTEGSSGDPIKSDYFPTVITEADYLISIPAMKAHARGGVTLTAKIHFGSNLRGNAVHLHGGLVAPDKMTTTSTLRPGYGLYRVQVDLLGNKYLGGNTLLFIVDALWSGSEANDPPRKFQMLPFNNDWTSSIFVSQDPIALESVCFDFLKAEFTESNPYGSYPQMVGTDDYILQAADSSYWPADIKYDPENDGTTIGSLGVCEHWNNAEEKVYTGNLNSGNGIDLIYLDYTTTSVEDIGLPSKFELYQNYPNPFNPSTNISFVVNTSGYAVLKVYDILGNEVITLFESEVERGKLYNLEFNRSRNIKNEKLASGVYISRLTFEGQSISKKMILLK